MHYNVQKQLRDAFEFQSAGAAKLSSFFVEIELFNDAHCTLFRKKVVLPESSNYMENLF